MKALTRRLAILLAVLLVFSTSMAYAASPNANPNAMKNKAMNPAKIKTMAKIGLFGELDLEDLKDAIEVVDLRLLPAESSNVGRVVGSIEIDEDYEDDFNLSMFKGNTKLKLKLGNVTVNVDKLGNFSQTMPLWKLPGMEIKLYMGHIYLYTVDEDIVEDMYEQIPVQIALDRAIAAVDKLPNDLDDLTEDDANLVEKARTAVDILKAALDAEDIKSGTVFDQYKALLKEVEEAEKEMDDILEDLISWDEEPEWVREDRYYGKLDFDSKLAGRLEVLVEVEDEVDLVIVPTENGRFFFETDTDEDIVIKVYFDDVEVEDLEFTIDVD